MSTIKDLLFLLAIFVAYGIAGRMDYDDAVMLEQAQRASRSARVECAPAEATLVTESVARARPLPLDSLADEIAEADRKAVAPCPIIID